MKKNNGYYRYQHKKHALRHKKITEQVYGCSDYFNEFNKYDSFKIHCSCPMCSAKTNNKGHYGIAMNWSPRDRRQLDEMDYNEEEEIE